MSFQCLSIISLSHTQTVLFPRDHFFLFGFWPQFCPRIVSKLCAMKFLASPFLQQSCKRTRLIDSIDTKFCGTVPFLCPLGGGQPNKWGQQASGRSSRLLILKQKISNDVDVNQDVCCCKIKFLGCNTLALKETNTKLLAFVSRVLQWIRSNNR